MNQGIEVIVRYRRDMSILQSVLALVQRREACTLSEQYTQTSVAMFCVPLCNGHTIILHVLFVKDATAAHNPGRYGPK